MSLLFWGLALILAGGACPLLLRRWGTVAEALYATLLVGGCLTGTAAGIEGLVRPPVNELRLLGSIPGGPWVFGLDALSAWFVVVILGVGAAAGLYGVGYLAADKQHRSVAGPHLGFATLLIGLVGVVTSQSVVPFLASWEVMALSAYFLVIYDSDRAEVRRAGLIYVILTHLSTLALVGMFAALTVHARDSSYAAIAAGNQVASPERALALGLGLVGFGVKAGVVPLHFWLPGAHAAAPSHVSAVLSGVMLKTGIYGLLRLVELVGRPPLWFGWALLALGLVSGVLGVLWALHQHDLKRLLAYHSVENIGIILLGIGVGVLGLGSGEPVVATLGFAGAVLHTLNHALFKSLLFLGAGAVLRATGLRLINQLGGLARRMPLTAIAFGVGSAAIVGLPPLNGFVSEWFVFGGLLTAGRSSEAIRFAGFGAAGLGLIGGLALACFSKVGGVMFLGEPRAQPTESTAIRDPGATMVAPSMALAAVCIAIGLVPAVVVRPALRVVEGIIGSGSDLSAASREWTAAAGRVSIVSISLIAVTLLLAWLRTVQGRRREARAAETWACAGEPLTARMQYTASSYAAPLLLAFSPLTGFRAGGHHHSVDVIKERAALPAWRRLKELSRWARDWQGARLRWYLLSVIATLVTLLLYHMTWNRGP